MSIRPALVIHRNYQPDAAKCVEALARLLVRRRPGETTREDEEAAERSGTAAEGVRCDRARSSEQF